MAGVGVSPHRTLVVLCRFIIGEETNSQQNQVFRRLRKNRMGAYFYPLHVQADKISIPLPYTMDGLESLLALRRRSLEGSAWPITTSCIHDIIFMAQRQLQYFIQNQLEPPSPAIFDPQPQLPEPDPDGECVCLCVSRGLDRQSALLLMKWLGMTFPAEVEDINPPGSVANIPTFFELLHRSVSFRLTHVLCQEVPPHLTTMQALHALYTNALCTIFPENAPNHLGQMWARYYLISHYIRFSLANFLHTFIPPSQPLPSDRQSATNMALWIKLKREALTADFPPVDGHVSWENLAEDVLTRW